MLRVISIAILVVPAIPFQRLPHLGVAGKGLGKLPLQVGNLTIRTLPALVAVLASSIGIVAHALILLNFAPAASRAACSLSAGASWSPSPQKIKPPSSTAKHSCAAVMIAANCASRQSQAKWCVASGSLQWLMASSAPCRLQSEHGASCSRQRQKRHDSRPF